MTSVCKFPSARAAISTPTVGHVWFCAGLAVLLSLGSVVPASAQNASEWDRQTHSASRLIAGAMTTSDDTTNHGAAFLRAGIEIRLAPGWRTYWRDPGDSGAPPMIDFSGSQNVKTVNVLWPAPQRFPDGAGGSSIGYTDHVILPLHVVPAEDSKQTALQLKLGYDICSNICIPVEANFTLALNGNGAEEPAIEQAELRVPRRATLGIMSRQDLRTQDLRAEQDASRNAFAAVAAQRQSDALAILRVHRQPGDGRDHVIVDVAAASGASVDLFVEGPTPDWALPLPQQTGGQNGGNDTIRHFAFDLEGLPPGARPEGADLTFTAVSGDDAIEVTTHLD
jgi:DsbC/DsbD-like thiol-disulfide interchange protein